MEPILSKQEIADLLSTLKHPEAHSGKSIESSTNITATGYDNFDLFHGYAKFSKPQAIPNLDLIMDLFAEDFSKSLSQALQCSVNATATKLSYQRFDSYLVSESNGGAIGLIKAEPLSYGGIITFSPSLAFSLIEMLLGGTPSLEAPQPDRSNSRLELSILEAVLKAGCRSFQRAMIPIVRVQADLIKTTHDVRLISLASPDSELAVCTFDVHSEHFSAPMQLVFPTATFTSFMKRFENLLNMDGFTDSTWHMPVSTQLDAMQCTVMAQADVIDMTIKEFLSLKTGDTLSLSQPPGDRVSLLVEGTVKFSGIQMEKNRKRHVRISDISD